MIPLTDFAPPPPVRLLVPSALPSPLRLETVRVDDPARPALEAFIHGLYAHRFGACVRSFAPVLVGLRDADGELLAAAGYRGAAEGPLFLERYLQGPVEALLAAQMGGAIDRASVVEIGHLCAAQPGAGRSLMLQLGPHLARRRFRWAASTLTRELRLMLRRLGVSALNLGPARPEALGAEAAAWGSYYTHAPEVLAGEIRPLQAARALPSAGGAN